ncbi:MAG: LEA type 2 family protein [Gemmatimonadales bacterium]|nr:LEA type 2 family protein [Gemmatimonadales bacterium]
MLGCRKLLLGACLVPAAVGCTPLGLWVYDDPELEVSRVRLSHDSTGATPVVLGLAVSNPNDYDLSTARLELQLRLDDVTVGQFSRDSIIPLPKSAIADFTLPLTMPAGLARARIRALSSGTRHFAVEGRATFSTPFGLREVRFAHQGDLAFGRGTDAGVGADSGGVRQGAETL